MSILVRYWDYHPKYLPLLPALLEQAYLLRGQLFGITANGEKEEREKHRDAILFKTMMLQQSTGSFSYHSFTLGG